MKNDWKISCMWIEAWDLITVRKSEWIKANRIYEGHNALTEYAIINKCFQLTTMMIAYFVYFDWPFFEMTIAHFMLCKICCVDAYIWNGFHLVWLWHLRIPYASTIVILIFSPVCCLSNACCSIHWLLVNLNMTSALYTRCLFFFIIIKFTAFEYHHPIGIFQVMKFHLWESNE